MKKTIIISVFCILGFLSSKAQFQFGLTGGFDYSSMNVRSEFQSDFGIKGVPAYHFGIASKYAFTENFHLTADLLFSKKGFKQSNISLSTPESSYIYAYADYKVSLNYIEIPVLAEFNVKFDKANILFGIGPYAAYGIGGKIDLDVTSSSENVSYSENVRWGKYRTIATNVGETIVWNSRYSSIKRLDYGSVVRFGVGYHSFVLNAEYKYGLANLLFEFRKNEKISNQSLGLSLVYLLHKKKQ